MLVSGVSASALSLPIKMPGPVRAVKKVEPVRAVQRVTSPWKDPRPKLEPSEPLLMNGAVAAASLRAPQAGVDPEFLQRALEKLNNVKKSGAGQPDSL